DVLAPRPGGAVPFPRGLVVGWARAGGGTGFGRRHPSCALANQAEAVSLHGLVLVPGHAGPGDRPGAGRRSGAGRSLHLRAAHRAFPDDRLVFSRSRGMGTDTAPGVGRAGGPSGPRLWYAHVATDRLLA